MKTTFLVATSTISLLIGINCKGQNIGINTDGSAAETGVMLDVKIPTAKATTAVVGTFFQIKSLDANTDALKFRFGFKTDATQANRYSFIDFPDFTASTPTYLPIALQPSGGKVGIGTTNPATLLHVQGAAPSILVAGSAANDVPTVRFIGEALTDWRGGYMQYDGTPNKFIIGVHNTADLLTTSDVQSIVIDRATSYVGIGTASPVLPLHVFSNANTSPLYLKANATYDAFSVLPWSGVTYISSGVYYKNSAWVHDATNTSSAIVGIQPNGGLLWYNSSNSSVSWNVAGTYQWDIYGYWKNLVQSTATGNSYFTGGNLGIGNTGPSTKLDITSDATGGIRVYGPVSGIANGMIQVRDNDAGGVVAWPGGGHITIWPSAAGLGIFRFVKSGISSWNFIDRSTVNSAAGRILAIHDANGVGDIMTFWGNGNVGIGTTTPSYPLTVYTTTGNQGILATSNATHGYLQILPGTPGYHAYNNLNQAGDNAIVFGASTGATATAFNIVPWQLSTTGIKIYCPTTTTCRVGINQEFPGYTLDIAGTAYCPAGAWASDLRKKKNIQPLALNGLEIISKLRPVTYEWKEALDEGMKGVQMGFIAQELEKILPTMILTKDDSLQSKGVKYLEMLPILVKAIQEQQKIIDQQQSEMAAMQTENKQMQVINASMVEDLNKLKAAVEVLLKQTNISPAGILTGTTQK